MNTHAVEIIDALGGTAKVAKLCEVTMPSVSDWRKDGIPKARLMYLKAVRPDVFGVATARAKTARAAIKNEAGAAHG